MDYIKFIKFLRYDFERSNKKYPTIKFFRSDLILIFIWFWSLEKMYAKKNVFIEELIDEIPKGFGSRPTILKFINYAIKKKHMLKISDLKDKRKFNLIPSEQTIKEFEDWAKGYKGF
tara:strand:- start:203 stop:553 length:351 start_codon:yes stop_codon:yes gene_type:complete